MNFLKKTTILVMLSAVFAACEKEKTTDHLTDCEEFGVERTELSCKSYTFRSNLSDVDPNPDWYVYTHPNPTPVHYGNDSNAFVFNPKAPGNYTVEAVYKSDLCDEAVTKGFDVDVDAECFPDLTVACEDFAVEKTEHSCNSFSFTTNVESAYMKVDGELKAYNSKAFDFDAVKPEHYVIEIGYESEGCPMGASKEFIIEVDKECFDDGVINCEDFEVETTEHSCSSFSFMTNVESAYMMVNGDLTAHGQKGFDFDPKEPGTYIIEIGFENENCPDGAIKEIVIDVDKECFDDGVIACEDYEVETTQHSCKSYSLTTNGDNPYWLINGENQGHSWSTIDFDAEKSGNYIIEVGFENEHCPDGVIKSVEIDASEDCFR